MRPGAARQLVTFLARPRKVTKGRPPRCRAHFEWVTLCCLPRQGDCATRPGEAHTTCLTAGLTRFPAGVAWGGIRVVAPVLTMSIRVYAPVPANGAALNGSQVQCSSKTPCRGELLGAPQGEERTSNSNSNSHGTRVALKKSRGRYTVLSITPCRMDLLSVPQEMKGVLLH